MSSSKSDGDLYRPIIKEGTHLAPSKKTPGAYRGTQLSDANNQVDGQTEWVKVDESELDYNYSLPYSYQESHAEVELTEEQRELAAMIGKAIAEGTIWVLNEVVAPRVKSWWQEKAAPSIKKAWQGLSDKEAPQKNAGKRQLRAAQIIEAREAVPKLFTQELDEAYKKYTNDISNEEAQQELLDIFMLSAVVAAKMRKLANARIRDKVNKTGAYIEGKEVVERLSTPQFVNSINAILESNPKLLEEMSVPLAGIFGRSPIIDGRYIPIEREVLREALALK